MTGSTLKRSEVVDLVRNQLAEILEIDADSIAESSSFADDLDAARWRIDDEDLEDLRTVREAIDYVTAKLEIT